MVSTLSSCSFFTLIKEGHTLSEDYGFLGFYGILRGNSNLPLLPLEKALCVFLLVFGSAAELNFCQRRFLPVRNLQKMRARVGSEKREKIESSLLANFLK